jgi:GntR family transcriptional regulator, transcriptional repressor for pyruvate dehydrogenase complex
MLEPIKHTTLREEAAEQIRALIVDGQLRPGDRLPSERDLTVRLAVSRTTIREALRSLEIRGLLDVKPGEGAFVRELPLEAVIDPLASALLDRRSLLELLEVRRTLEPGIAALAAQRAQAGDIDEMKRILAEIEVRLTNHRYDDAVKSIISFHRIITRATGNGLIQRLMDTISGLFSASMRETLRIRGRPGRSLKSHRQILAAIESRDPAGARETMLSHLQGLEDAVLGLA